MSRSRCSRWRPDLASPALQRRRSRTPRHPRRRTHRQSHRRQNAPTPAAALAPALSGFRERAPASRSAAARRRKRLAAATDFAGKDDAMPALTRRSLFAGAAIAVIGTGADPAAAIAPPADKQVPAIYRYKIGSYQITALYDGIWYRPIADKFIRNAPFTEVEHALDAAFMPHDKLATPFTALVVNTG